MRDKEDSGNRLRIITFTGPSGSGKTTIITELFVNKPELRFLPSYTTRKPRGSDFPSEFCYVSKKEFESLKDDNKFIWSVEVHGNSYGTLFESIDNVQTMSVMTLVPKATAQLFEYLKGNIIPFFILPPSEAILRERLLKRGEDKETIEKRIKDCVEWEEKAKKSLIPYIYITNETTVDDAVIQVENYIDKEI